MSRERLKRRRDNAIKEQDNKCFFCGEEMMPVGEMLKGKPHPKAATIDHLNPRLSDGRHNRSAQERIVTPRGHKARNVASCWTCNNIRNAEHQKTLPIHVLHSQSRFESQPIPQPKQTIPHT